MKRLFLKCLVVMAVLLAARAQAQVTEATVFKQTADRSTVACFSFDGKKLVIGGEKGSLVMWDMPACVDSRVLPAMKTKIKGIAMSPDGKYVLSLSEDNVVQIWNSNDGNAYQITASGAKINAIAVSPDGRFYATAEDDNTAKVYDLDSKNRTQVLRGHGSPVLAVAFSPDGERLATGSADKTARVWDFKNGNTTHTLNGHIDWVRTLDYSPDGKLLATGSYDRSVRLWEKETGKNVVTIPDCKNWVIDVKFSWDGQYIAAGSADQTARIFSVKDGALAAKLPTFKDYVYNIDFNTNGRYLVASDLSMKNVVWDVSGLNIKPYRAPDLNPPNIVMLSPRGGRVKGIRKAAYAYQDRTPIVVQVMDTSGVKNVMINGQPAERVKDVEGQYEVPGNFPPGFVGTITITAVDGVGNTVTDVYDAERKDFRGTVEGRYFALLIAENDYKDPNVNDLDNPVKDATRLRDVLIKHYTFEPDNVFLLKNATRSQIVAKLDELQSALGRSDNLIIFYAGHGIWDEELKQGFFIPVEASFNNRADWFSNGTLRDYVNSIKTRHTLLIADACFSGGIFKSRGAFNNASQAVEEMYKYPSRKAMTSGALKTVPDKSVFLEYLTKRLEQNEEPFLGAMDLFSSFRTAVVNNSPNGQIPQYGEIGQTGDEGGEFIFVKRGVK
jgi:WD40 repeat protein